MERPGENAGMSLERVLGRSGIPAGAMGLGCWAIGGPFWLEGRADGWGDVDDDESIRAIHRAIELGVRFFDTADVYGTGHSEEVLGRALAGRRHDAVIATKFGYTFDAESRQATGVDVSPAYVRRACAASLRRLGTDVIDLYQLHVGLLPRPQAEEVAGVLDDLRAEGLIRAYGWSTDDPDCARLFARMPYCTAIQHNLNVFEDPPELLGLCEQHDLASVNRTPLAMGFLSGKFGADSRLPADDVRAAGHDWVRYFEDGRPKQEWLDRLAAVREVLTSGGRTLAQGALAWIWGRSERTIPIPGFKSVRQVEENARALDLGPLTAAQTAEIDRVLRRSPVAAA
jgi:aryl-alcohol dehydrogenase-like predicted oxidoreductase